MPFLTAAKCISSLPSATPEQWLMPRPLQKRPFWRFFVDSFFVFTLQKSNIDTKKLPFFKAPALALVFLAMSSSAGHAQLAPAQGHTQLAPAQGHTQLAPAQGCIGQFSRALIEEALKDWLCNCLAVSRRLRSASAVCLMMRMQQFSLCRHMPRNKGRSSVPSLIRSWQCCRVSHLANQLPNAWGNMQRWTKREIQICPRPKALHVSFRGCTTFWMESHPTQFFLVGLWFLQVVLLMFQKTNHWGYHSTNNLVKL